MCAQLHFNICKEIEVKLDNKHLYDHAPKSAETSHEVKVTILRNQQVRTDRTLPNNKPDVTIRENKKGPRMLKAVAIPGDRNVIKKEAEKILKYKDLALEIQRIWNVKVKVIPVIIGTTRTVPESLRQHLRNMAAKHAIGELQTAAILGTAHKRREVLM